MESGHEARQEPDISKIQEQFRQAALINAGYKETGPCQEKHDRTHVGGH
jgi:hypothetical protein